MAGESESGLVKSNAFVLVSTLLLLQHVTYIGSVIAPTITISPTSLNFENDDDTLQEDLTVECSFGGSGTRYKLLTSLEIKRKADQKVGEGNSVEQLVLSADQITKEPTLRGNFSLSVKYDSSGSLGGGSIFQRITLIIKGAECEDAGKYTCTAVYTLEDEEGDKMSAEDAYLETKPYRVNVTRTPANSSIHVGDELTLCCEGRVGTLKNDDMRGNVKLTWAARNRHSATEHKYNELEEELKGKIQFSILSQVGCTELQRVKLNLKVHKIRDSQRDYFCVAALTRKTGKVERIGAGRDSKIAMPSFEEPKMHPIRAGGFVGIGAGAMALLSGSIFGVIWGLRRGEKKTERVKELQFRRSLVKERVKSISTIVDKRRSRFGVMEPDASSLVSSSVVESSMAESSMAESSMAEPSMADSSVLESSTAVSSTTADETFTTQG